MTQNNTIANSRVKDAFEIALTKDSNYIGRNSWDQTTALVAVRGIAPWYAYRKLNFDIETDGKNVLVPGEKCTYLTFKQTPEAIVNFVEELIKHQPVKQ